MLQTEFEFVLPRGYRDETGTLHRSGIMRLATTKDEIEPLSDPRAKNNELYLGVLLLSRVVTRLGSIAPVGPATIENLFSSDFSFLQELYLAVNQTLPKPQNETIETQCPQCGQIFALEIGHNNPQQSGEVQ